MELTRYRYFLDIAESGNMTKSAERLHIAQPALSQAIAKLENSLGVPLFVKSGRNIVLTAYGRYLQTKLSPIVASLDEIPENHKTMAELWDETIHISVKAASGLVTEAIIEYGRRHPDINFQLLQNVGDDIFDIEITTAPEHTPSVGRDKCIDEKIFLAVSDSGKFGSRTSISLSELKNEGFVSLLGSRQFRNICDLCCSKAGFTPNIIFESDNLAAVKNMIAAGLGVGFWPEFTWGHIEHDNVLLLKIDGLPLRRAIIFSHNKNKADNRHVKDFYDFLYEYFVSRKNA